MRCAFPAIPKDDLHIIPLAENETTSHRTIAFLEQMLMFNATPYIPLVLYELLTTKS